MSVPRLRTIPTSGNSERENRWPRQPSITSRAFRPFPRVHVIVDRIDRGSGVCVGRCVPWCLTYCSTETENDRCDHPRCFKHTGRPGGSSMSTNGSLRARPTSHRNDLDIVVHDHVDKRKHRYFPADNRPGLLMPRASTPASVSTVVFSVGFRLRHSQGGICPGPRAKPPTPVSSFSPDRKSREPAPGAITGAGRSYPPVDTTHQIAVERASPAASPNRMDSTQRSEYFCSFLVNIPPVIRPTMVDRCTKLHQWRQHTSKPGDSPAQTTQDGTGQTIAKSRCSALTRCSVHARTHSA